MSGASPDLYPAPLVCPQDKGSRDAGLRIIAPKSTNPAANIKFSTAQCSLSIERHERVENDRANRSDHGHDRSAVLGGAPGGYAADDADDHAGSDNSRRACRAAPAVGVARRPSTAGGCERSISDLLARFPTGWRPCSARGTRDLAQRSAPLHTRATPRPIGAQEGTPPMMKADVRSKLGMATAAPPPPPPPPPPKASPRPIYCKPEYHRAYREDEPSTFHWSSESIVESAPRLDSVLLPEQGIP